MRIALWARRRPSRQFLIVLGVVAVAAVVFGVIEHVFGWPEALTVNRIGRDGGLGR